MIILVVQSASARFPVLRAKTFYNALLGIYRYQAKLYWVVLTPKTGYLADGESEMPESLQISNSPRGRPLA